MMDGEGKRSRKKDVAGESYYITATRNVEDGGIDFIVEVPDRNKATGAARRETAERICAMCSQLTRMV